MSLLVPVTVALLVTSAVGSQAPASPVASSNAPDGSVPLKFESASVKLHPAPPNYYLLKNYRHAPPYVIPTSNHFTDSAHFQDLVMEAYGLTESQIRFLPAWALAPYGQIWDVDAIAGGGVTPTPQQFQEMLQALLADRFQLKVHRETKTKMSVYALVVDKKEPKFHEFHAKAPEPGTPNFAGTTIFALARFLSLNVEFPVVDRTGLPAVPYDFDLDTIMNYHELDREQQDDPLSAQDYIHTTVQHELGLRMEPRKEDWQYLIVDHAEQPSDK
jgi:uncharacterized protein (TIGR03435 family)